MDVPIVHDTISAIAASLYTMFEEEGYWCSEWMDYEIEHGRTSDSVLLFAVRLHPADSYAMQFRFSGLRSVSSVGTFAGSWQGGDQFDLDDQHWPDLLIARTHYFLYLHRDGRHPSTDQL